MRKITTLLTLLLLCIVGAKAQHASEYAKVSVGNQVMSTSDISAGELYLIKSKGLTVDAAATSGRQFAQEREGGTIKFALPNALAADCLFKLVSDGAGGFYIQANSGKWFKGISVANDVATSTVAESERAAFTFDATDTAGEFRMHNNGHRENIGGGGDPDPTLKPGKDTSSSAWSIFYIYKAVVDDPVSTIAINSLTGSFTQTNNGAIGSQLGKEWKDANGIVTLFCSSGNNMAYNDMWNGAKTDADQIALYATTGGTNYSFSVDNAYSITGYTFTGITTGGGNVVATTSETNGTFNGTSSTLSYSFAKADWAQSFTLNLKASSSAQFFKGTIVITVFKKNTGEVTYIIYDNTNTEIDRHVVAVPAGTTITDIPSEYKKDFMEYTYSAPVTVEVSGTYTFSATENGYNYPFKVSTEGDEHWYMLGTKGGYWLYSNGSSVSGRNNRQTRNANTRFAIYGNSDDGFTLKNQATNTFVSIPAAFSSNWSWHASLSSTASTFNVLEADNGFYLTTKSILNVGNTEGYLGYNTGKWLADNNGTGLAVWGKSYWENNGIFVVNEVGIQDLSQLSNEKYYYLTVPRGSLAVGNGSLKSTMKEGWTAGKFAIINYEDNLYLWSVDDNKFIVGTGEESDLPTTVVTFNGDAPFMAKLGDNYINIAAGYDAGVVVNSANTPDDGNLYAITEAGDFDPTNVLALLDAYFHPSTIVNYVIVDGNGLEVARLDGQYAEAGDVLTAESLPSSIKRDFCTYTATDYNVVEGENTFTATVTYSMPFEISTDFDNAHWYNMTIRTNRHVFMGSTEPYYPASSATYAQKEQGEYRWAFMGNPYKGITVLNKAAGADYTLTKDGINVVMREGSYSWSILKSNDGFILKETGSATNYVNQNGGEKGYLGFWNNALGATDDGSTFRVTDAIDNYYELVEAEVIPFLMDSEMNPSATIGKAFGLSQAAATSIVQTYLTQLNNQIFTLSEYEAIAAAKNDGILYPTDGFYRVRSVSNGKYIHVKSYNQGDVIAELDESAATNDVSSVIEVRTVDEKPYMLSNTGWFNWVYSTSNKGYVKDKKDKYVHWLAVAPGVGAFAICYGNGEGSYAGYLNYGYYTMQENGTCVGSNGSSSAGSATGAQWIFEPATSVTVKLNDIEGDHAYATFYAPFDVEFNGATAYTVTRGAAVDGVGSEAVVTAIEGTVPAGTPVVLIADEGTAACVATIKGTGAETLTAENILSGHYFAGTVEENSLVFGKANGVAGFYKYNDYKTVLAANRAFIAPEEAASVRALVFVDPTTGISSSLFNTENGTTYDLSGRRVNNTSKGLYIQNGKKVLVK